MGRHVAHSSAQERLSAHLQIGMVTWLLALLAIELALTHHAVWKVHPSNPHLFCVAFESEIAYSSVLDGRSFSFCCVVGCTQKCSRLDKAALRSAFATICRAGCQGCGRLALLSWELLLWPWLFSSTSMRAHTQAQRAS